MAVHQIARFSKNLAPEEGAEGQKSNVQSEVERAYLLKRADLHIPAHLVGQTISQHSWQLKKRSSLDGSWPGEAGFRVYLCFGPEAS